MQKKRRLRSFNISLMTSVIIIILWGVVTAFKLISPVLLTSPARVMQTFLNLCTVGYNGTLLYQHYLITLGRLLIAVILAIVIGIPLGLLSGYVPTIKAVVDPIVQFIRPIPPLAYYTLLILWLGIGETSKVTLLFLAALPPIYLACFDAVVKINREYIRGAYSLGADHRQIFFHVVFPAALPDVFTGVRSAVGVAYTTIVSAEMIAASAGIGWMIVDASHYLKSDVMFVGIIVLGVTGVVLDWLIKLVENRVVDWRGRY